MGFRSQRLQSIEQSDIRAMTKQCQAVSGINMGQGLCEYPTPAVILEAAQKNLSDPQRNIYSSAAGILPLREAMAKKLAQDNQIKVNPETEVLVTVGASGAYLSTLTALLNSGDKIVLFEPFYGYHLNPALVMDLEPHFIPMQDSAYTYTYLKSQIPQDAKAMVLCTPSNPSGKMLTMSEMEALVRIAEENDMLIITDEMYEYFRYEGQAHISIASLPNAFERTITMMGLSKTFSITGWRLGYLSGPAALIQQIQLANDLFYICAPTPLQWAAIKGFELPLSHFQTLASIFETRRNKLFDTLTGVGFNPIKPQGAYYMLTDVSICQKDSYQVALDILKQVGVASIPGRAFFHSDQGSKYLRFNFALTDDKFEEACQRLSEFKC